jgi:hypothetical protein
MSALPGDSVALNRQAERGACGIPSRYKGLQRFYEGLQRRYMAAGGSGAARVYARRWMNRHRAVADKVDAIDLLPLKRAERARLVFGITVLVNRHVRKRGRIHMSFA